MSEIDLNVPVSNEEKSENIFDEFSTDSSLIDEVKKLKEEASKDVFYYLNFFGKILQNIFIVLLIIIILIYLYIYVQKNENIADNSIIDPICFLFMDSNILKPDSTAYCSSIAFTKSYYDKKFENIIGDQTSKIFNIIVKIYEESSFTKKREIVFLLDKSTNRLSILNVMEKFDTLKNDFGIDKSRIQCENININTDTRILELSCSAFSRGYEKDIIGFSGNKSTKSDYLEGTSITFANSFLNFIEKNSKDFTLIDKQKIFNNVSVASEKNGYTNKTSFDVKLKINF